MTINGLIKQEKIMYEKVSRWRDSVFGPLADICIRVGITANHLSAFRIVTAIIFLVFVRSNPLLVSTLLLIGVATDLVDGVIARQQHQASLKGRIIDVVADNITFSLYILGIMTLGFLPPLLAGLYVYFTLLSLGIRVTRNILLAKGIQKSLVVIGIPSICNVGSYLLLPLYMFTDIQIYTPVLIVFFVILVIETAFNFGYILRHYHSA